MNECQSTLKILDQVKTVKSSESGSAVIEFASQPLALKEEHKRVLSALQGWEETKTII